MANSKAYTCRLGDANSVLIEDAAADTGMSRAELLRSAFSFYRNQNPDNIDIFNEIPSGSETNRTSDEGQTSTRKETKSKGAVDKQSGTEGSTPLKSPESGFETCLNAGIYDPTLECERE